MKSELAIIETPELNTLAKSINDREGAIQVLKKRTIDGANQAITEAILQGQELLKAKQIVPAGLFVAWLAANCKSVSQRHAYNYMKLANGLQRVANLDEAASLRAALALCNTQTEQHEPNNEPTPAYESGLLRFTKALSFVERAPLIQWPEQAKDKLREELKPVVRELWPDGFASQ